MMCQAYMRLKEHTGLRQIDLLLLKVSAAGADGILVHVSKTRNTTGRRQLFSWQDKDGNDNGLRALWYQCLEARPVDIAPWLFCTEKGKCYIDPKTAKPTSFNSVWKRFMDRVLKETKLTERFAERDIRAKTGSDQETDADSQHKLGERDAEDHPEALPPEADGGSMTIASIAQHRIYSATLLVQHA
jgi:hypothetical protein